MSNQTPAEKIEQYLTDAGVFYFTTAEKQHSPRSSLQLPHVG
jgi:hypothetical protein